MSHAYTSTAVLTLLCSLLLSTTTWCGFLQSTILSSNDVPPNLSRQVCSFYRRCCPECRTSTKHPTALCMLENLFHGGDGHSPLLKRIYLKKRRSETFIPAQKFR